jgi:hypothetical protein
MYTSIEHMHYRIMKGVKRWRGARSVIYVHACRCPFSQDPVDTALEVVAELKRKVLCRAVVGIPHERHEKCFRSRLRHRQGDQKHLTTRADAPILMLESLEHARIDLRTRVHACQGPVSSEHGEPLLSEFLIEERRMLEELLANDSMGKEVVVSSSFTLE